MDSDPAAVSKLSAVSGEVALAIAARAARKAGALVYSKVDSLHSIEYKGERDLVTEMDRRAEELIISMIREKRPEDGILSEERAEEKGGSACRWIIDPIDGTTNYSHSFPFFCISIAFEVSGVLTSGVVYDPVRDELFSAVRSGGAFLNGKKINVSSTGKLDRSLLATGFPYDIGTSKENNLDHFSNLAVRAQAIRRAGAAALDLSYVACGRLDGFWELKLKPWDVAAAMLIIREAGGLVTDFGGESASVKDTSRIVASNSHIHKEMMEVLKRA